MIRLPLWIFTKSEDFPFFIQYGYHDSECYLHGHEDFSELVIVLEGSAEHTVGTEHYPISKGDVFVINQDTEHGFTGVSDFRICNIMFRPEVLFEHIYNIRQSPGFQALFVVAPHYLQNHRFSSRLHLQSQEFAAVKAMIRDMITEYNRKQEGWQTYCYACFLQLCVRLSRLYQLTDTEQHRCVMQLAAATAYMEGHFCSSISVAELAQMSGYSQRQFSRLFKEAYGVSPNAYITNLRIQKAQQLLQNTQLPIGEIAWNCGFEDQNYFSRMFRQTAGVTPSAYRNRERNNVGKSAQ